LATLTQTRCFNHGQREAVARCPACRRHYCRECVTEHDHRLLCASCIAAAGEKKTKPRRFTLPLAPLVQLAVAIVVYWVAFLCLGAGLLMVPTVNHDAMLNPPEAMFEDTGEESE